MMHCRDVLALCSMNAPVMVALDGETDPLEVGYKSYLPLSHALIQVPLTLLAT